MIYDIPQNVTCEEVKTWLVDHAARIVKDIKGDKVCFLVNTTGHLVLCSNVEGGTA